MCRTDENGNPMKSINGGENGKKKGQMSGESKSMNSHEVKKEPFSFLSENEFIPVEHWQCETCRHGAQGNTSFNKNDVNHSSGIKGEPSQMAEDEVKVYKRREKKSSEENMEDNYQGNLANANLKEKSIGEASKVFNPSNLQSGLIKRPNRASNIDLNLSRLQIPKEEAVEEEKGRERPAQTITNGVRLTSLNMNKLGNAWLFRHLMEESRKSPFSLQTEDWKYLENLLRPEHGKSGQAQQQNSARQKQKISTSPLQFQQPMDERIQVNLTQRKRKEPAIDLEAAKPPVKINGFSKYSGCSTDMNLTKLSPIGDHLQNLNPTILPEESFNYLMMKMTNTLMKARGPLKVWSEEELDYLWVGVRRHGQGNWVAILGDPSLPFSKHKTIYDLAERWNKEKLKIVGHANLPIPGAQVGSSNANNLLFGGLVNIPQVNGEEEEEEEDDDDDDDENLSQTGQPETITISSEGTLSNN